VRPYLIALFAVISFAPAYWGAWRGRLTGLWGLLPPVAYAGLCAIAYVVGRRKPSTP